MRKPLALVDLDGTLADFQGAMRRDLEKLRSPEEPTALPWDDDHDTLPAHMRARWDMIKRQPDWWFNLEYMESGKFLVKTLKDVGFKIHLLTRAPRRYASAWEQKVRWAQQHLPDVEMTIAPTKSMVYGKVLVDDWPEYVLPWLDVRPRGIVILPDQPWNRLPELDQHPRIHRYTYGKNEQAIGLILVKHFANIKAFEAMNGNG